MHKEIMHVPQGLLVDHQNHDGLDNRRANLRVATPRENACNVRKVLRPCSSKYKGVCYDKDKNLWRAYITYNGKRIYLGRFETEEEAARAYDNAAKIYHKEFASLNFY